MRKPKLNIETTEEDWIVSAMKTNDESEAIRLANERARKRRERSKPKKRR